MAYEKRPTQEEKIYYLLQDRAGLGVKCFEFGQLLNITQHNARIHGLRNKLNCICKNTDTILFNCPAKQHIINKNDTTYLITPQPYQPSFI